MIKTEPCNESFINNEKILKIIENRLAIREDKKKKNGEVFTPVDLVCEMLNQLPDDVWKNKELKWLDPANGIGNFPIIVYYKLMKSLKVEIKNEKVRSKHIIENMLYMIELDSENYNVCEKIFKLLDSNAKPNIYNGSFFEDEWSTKTFDIVMGNPPYNKNGVGKGGGVFWKEFVFKGFDILNDDGYIVYVHPTGWRKPAGKRASAGDVFKLYKQYCLRSIKISDRPIKGFPRVDYYVVQKKKERCKTHIISEFKGIHENGNIDISDLQYIPHIVNEDVISIIKKLAGDQDTFDIINNQSFKPKKEDSFNIIRNQSFQPKKEDTTNNGIAHAFYYVPDTENYELRYKQYEEGKTPEYIEKDKIVLTYKSGKKPCYLYPTYYSKGDKMGTTSNTMYQEIAKDDKKDNIITLLRSSLIHFLLIITQYSESPNHINEFKILNMIKKPNQGIIKTDEDVYKYYGITDKEIEFIEKTINKKV